MEPLPDPKRSPTQLDELPQETPPEDVLSGTGVLVAGSLAGVDREGRILFRPEGSREPPVPVAIAFPVSDGVLVKSARLERRALVANTANAGLVLVGFLRERVDAKARDAGPGELEVLVDGETLNVHAERQIELRCGKSSITLTRAGKVLIRGAYLLSRSSGVNRIKGGSVQIN